MAYCTFTRMAKKSTVMLLGAAWRRMRAMSSDKELLDSNSDA